MSNCNACHDTGRIPLIIRADERCKTDGQRVMDKICPICLSGHKLFEHFTGKSWPADLTANLTDVTFFIPHRKVSEK